MNATISSFKEVRSSDMFRVSRPRTPDSGDARETHHPPALATLAPKAGTSQRHTALIRQHFGRVRRRERDASTARTAGQAVTSSAIHLNQLALIGKLNLSMRSKNILLVLVILAT